jgi:uncharacterized protein (DUF934 family)
VLQLANDADPLAIEVCLADIERIDLNFPKFTDGRAYSQAFLLRRRLGFTGDIRATGDVLIDQLVQMERTGFSSAVLKRRRGRLRRAAPVRALRRLLPGRCGADRAAFRGRQGPLRTD